MNLALDFDKAADLWTPAQEWSHTQRLYTSTFVPRHYQSDCIDICEHAFRSGLRSGIIVCCTGGGKTLLFCEIGHRLYKRGHPVLILVDRDNLADQAFEKLAFYYQCYKVGIEAGSSKASRDCDFIIASVQTLGRTGSTRLLWLANLRPSMVILDECEIVLAPQCQAVIKVFVQEGVPFLGVTATPERGDGKLIVGEDAPFERQLFEYDTLTAIRAKYLKRVYGERVYTREDISAAKVGRDGDLTEASTAPLVNTERRNRIALDKWATGMRDRSTVGFCTSVQHAMDASAIFRSAGVRCEYIHGSMSKTDQKAIGERVRTGETQVIMNCDLLIKGWDEPRISGMLMMRPTTSRRVYVQAAGRILRLYPGVDDALIYDFVDSTTMHSLVTAGVLLGLPANMDIQGRDLLEALEIYEKVAEAFKRVPMDQTVTLDDLDYISEHVDLLGLAETPVEIAAVSKLQWLHMPAGYSVKFGEGKQAVLMAEPFGNYRLTIYKSRDKIVLDTATDDIVQAVQFADAEIFKAFPDLLKQIMGGDPKGQAPASVAQLGWLRRHWGWVRKAYYIEEVMAEDITAAQAKKIMGRYHFTRRRGPGKVEPL